MAQRATKQKPSNPAMQQALQDAFKPSAPATVTPAPEAKPESGKVAQMYKVGVYDGANMVDAVSYPQVHTEDIVKAGASMKNLAFNLISETLDPAVTNPDAPCWQGQTLRDAKSAFFKLLKVPGAAGKSGATIIREAWNTDVQTRKADPKKRIVGISLSGLARLFKTPRAGGNTSPYTALKERMIKLAKDILTVVNAPKLQKDVKLRQIAEMVSAILQPEEEKE